MRRVEAGDLEGARQWLDWARDTMPSTMPEHAGGRQLPAAVEEGAEAGKDELRVAAASLMAFGKQAVRAIPFLSLARERAATDAERRGFDRDLLTAYFIWSGCPRCSRRRTGCWRWHRWTSRRSLRAT